MSPSIDLVSPFTDTPLRRLREGNGWQADDGTIYPENDGIVDLLDSRLHDDVVANEIKVFDELPISNVPYFRDVLFGRVIKLVAPMLPKHTRPPVCVELGGGEGYFARSFKGHFPNSETFVCDISERFLKLAPVSLKRLRCDIRYPFLQKGSVDLASFWVSFHHFSERDSALALNVAVDALAPDGLLMFFEPNNDFLPRRVLYKSPFAKNIYFDEEEKAVAFVDIENALSRKGLSLVYKAGVSPPYSLAFLRHYTLWPLYFAATEAFYFLDRLAMKVSASKSTALDSEFNEDSLSVGSYLLSIFRLHDKP